MSAIVKSHQPVIVEFAQKYGVDAESLSRTLKATCFKQPKRGRDDGPPPEVSDEQLVALLIVANQYGLNPWTKEIYAFPDTNGIVPIVGIDGWHRIANSNDQFDGIEVEIGPFATSHALRPEWDNNAKRKVLREVQFFGPEWVKVSVFRKDRTRAYPHIEYMSDCARDTDPWRMSPTRMLRNRAIAQAYRVAFGFGGIHEDDEAEMIMVAKSQSEPPRIAEKYTATAVETRAASKASLPASETSESPDAIRARVEQAIKAATSREAAVAVAVGAKDSVDGAALKTWINIYHPAQAPAPAPSPEPTPAPAPAPVEDDSEKRKADLVSVLTLKLAAGELQESDVWEEIERSQFWNDREGSRVFGKIKAAAAAQAA